MYGIISATQNHDFNHKAASLTDVITRIRNSNPAGHPPPLPAVTALSQRLQDPVGTYHCGNLLFRSPIQN